MTVATAKTSMLGRFEGERGRPALITALSQQAIAKGSKGIAAKLAASAEISACRKGSLLYAQGSAGKSSMYFVVSGSFDLMVNGISRRVISAGQAVGEFPIMNTSLAHAVTIRAREASVVARVPGERFRAIADGSKQVWRNMAEMLAERLRTATEWLPQPKPPRVFVGHGRNPLWTEVRRFIESLGIPVVAYESEPRSARSITAVLEEMLSQATFAVLVLTADDIAGHRRRRARQNVVHEAGLFQGALGFRCAVLLVQHGVESFSNIAGLQNIVFEGERIHEAFGELEGVLKREGVLASRRGPGVGDTLRRRQRRP